MSWLTEFQEAKAKAEAVAWYIDNLSDLLYQVGNTELSIRLSKRSVDLSNAIQEMDDAVGKNLDAQYKQAQEGSANMLKACLAGVKLAENENEIKTNT